MAKKKKAAKRKKSSAKSRAKKAYGKVKRAARKSPGTSGLLLGAALGVGAGYVLANMNKS
jgi:hypothetical protein